MAKITHKDVGNDLRVIIVSERLDVAGTEGVEPQFNSLVNSGRKDAVVDLAGVSFLSSMGIRMIIAGAKTLKAAGGRMALVVGENESVEKTLRATCVDAIIPLFAKAEDAETSLLS